MSGCKSGFEDVEQRLFGLGLSSIKINKASDRSEQGVGYTGDHHAPVIMSGEDEILKVIFRDKVANLTDVTGQVAGVLILQGRCENPVMVTGQEFNGSIPTMAGQTHSGRKIISFRAQVPGFGRHARAPSG